MHYYMRNLFPRMKAPSFFVEGQSNRESEREKQRSQVVCTSIKVSIVCVHSQSTQSAWQRPFSGINFIMMGKLAQLVTVGGACPPTFIISTITYKVVVYAAALEMYLYGAHEQHDVHY